MAEGVGFEPTVPLRRQRFSRPPPSATRTPLLDSNSTAKHRCGASLKNILLFYTGVRVKSYQKSWTEAPGEIGEVLYAIAGWVAKM